MPGGLIGGVGAGAGAGVGAGGVGVGGLGDPNNPTSIAYFNQTVGDRVLFAVDQSTLSPEARMILQGQARWLASNPGYAIIIEGHADEQGTREYNLALGERRALAVRAAMISAGIDGARVQTRSYGEERPVAFGHDEGSWSLNRRAEFIFTQM